MSNFRVEVKFRDSKQAYLIWYIESTSVSFLIEDVVDKLRTWMGAKGLYLKRLNEYRYSMILVTLHLGIVSIEVCADEEDDS